MFITCIELFKYQITRSIYYSVPNCTILEVLDST